MDDEDPLEVGDIESQDSKRNEEDIVENTLIKHENFSRVWRDVSLNEPVDGKPRFSEKLLNAIGGLTNCRAELEPGGKGIIIKGDDPQDVEKAISKLNVINNWMVSLCFYGYIKTNSLVLMLNPSPHLQLPIFGGNAGYPFGDGPS